MGGDGSQKWWVGEFKKFYLQIPLLKDPFFSIFGTPKNCFLSTISQGSLCYLNISYSTRS